MMSFVSNMMNVAGPDGDCAAAFLRGKIRHLKENPISDADWAKAPGVTPGFGN